MPWLDLSDPAPFRRELNAGSPRRRAAAMLAPAGIMLVASLSLAAPPLWLQQPKRFAEVPQAGATFGVSTAIDGDWFAIGAPHESAPVVLQTGVDAIDIALDVGKVYLYHRGASGWQYHSTLVGGQAGAQFGSAVALHGNDLLVGSPFYDILNGPADACLARKYRLDQDVWMPNGTIAAASPNAHLGSALALFGDGINTYAAIGTPDAGHGFVDVLRLGSNGNDVFETMTPPAGLVDGDTYGNALAGDGGELIVGARHRAVGGQANAGIAYVFFRTPLGDWQVSGQLAYPGPVLGDYAGYSVAIGGIWAAIGAPGRSLANKPVDTGAVQTFVYNNGDWLAWQEMTGSSADTDDEFGNSVALQGKHLLVGARDDDSHGGTPDIGSAYFFLRTDGFPVPLWNETGKFMNASPAQLDWFGFDVALSGSDAVVGTPLDATDAGTTLVQAGSITLFVYDQIFADGYD